MHLQKVESMSQETEKLERMLMDILLVKRFEEIFNLGLGMVKTELDLMAAGRFFIGR
jgi:hypothetical protein